MLLQATDAVVPPPTGAGAEVVPLFRRAAGARDATDRPRRDAPEPFVLRRELFERLAATQRVAIVCAPAGSGKTSLLRSWIEHAGLAGRAAWATAGSGGETLVERLSHAEQEVEEPGLLVIDDLHRLQSADALAALERFIAELPAHLRVVVLTRVHPRLGLHRLRLAGALTELRAADLRFSLPETRELLDRGRISLSEDGAALLHERTEGWAAGLRLATIALTNHPDPERFVDEFCGTERTVAAFLHAEIFDRQPPEVRDLLLRTSVLDRVNGPLADALTGGSGSLRILHELEEANAFVDALDVGRSWFRYHPLFADLLRQELRRAEPGIVAPLHRAAAQWFEEHGQPVEAIRHAQSAGDWLHAARALADHQLELALDGRIADVRALLAAFPPGSTPADGELALVAAATLLADGLHEEAAAQLAAAEDLAASVRADRRAAFDLTLAATALRLACARGDMERVPCAGRAIEAAVRAQPPSELRRTQIHRAEALVDLGIAELWSLRLAEARRHLEQALELARRIERPAIESACLSYLALEAALSGRPTSVAHPLVEQAAALVDACGCETHESAVAAFAVGGTTLLWRGRLVEAEQWLERAQRALTRGTSPGLELLLHHAWALLGLGQRRIDDALTALRAAERLQDRLTSEHPLALELRSRVLRTQVRLGETAAARAALDGMTERARASAEIRIAAAALELAEGRADQAAEELRPVIEGTAHARCYPWAATIEALLYDATAHRELGDAGAAAILLERALALAEREGVLLPFTLVGTRELLDRHRGHRTAHATLRSTILDVLAGSSPPSEAAPLLDPLSEAELRVVRYLPTNLKTPEIAAELYVSTNTVRTHLRHIYAKLGAHKRSEAVARARQLALLGPA